MGGVVGLSFVAFGTTVCQLSNFKVILLAKRVRKMTQEALASNFDIQEILK